jgi:hypothetical protein
MIQHLNLVQKARHHQKLPHHARIPMLDVTGGLGSALVASTGSSLHQFALPDHSAAQDTDQRTTVHVSDPGHTLGAPVSSPHCTVDIHPVARAGVPAPCTSSEVNVSVPASGSRGAGSEPGQSHAGREPEAYGVNERSPHIAIYIQPADRLAPRITSPGEAGHDVGGIVEFEHNLQWLTDLQSHPPICGNDPTGDNRGKRADRAQGFEEGEPSV